jgi:hypothetical protein
MTDRPDALALMSADYSEVTHLFEAYDALCERQASDIEKRAVTDRIRQLLRIRAQLESPRSTSPRWASACNNAVTV